VVPVVAIRIDSVPGSTIVAVSGEVDLLTVGALRRHLGALPGGDVVVDLSGVGFLAAVGMHALIELQRRRHRAGARVVLVSAGAPITRALDAAGCRSIFDMADGVEVALKLINESGDRPFPADPL
jgi:anti-anti-sigma factor